MPKTITISWEWIQEHIEKIRKIISQIVEWGILAGILFFLYGMVIDLHSWWRPNFESIGDYLDVKLSGLVVNLIALMIIPWLWVKILPINLLRKAAEHWGGAAIVLGSFIIALGLILFAK